MNLPPTLQPKTPGNGMLQPPATPPTKPVATPQMGVKLPSSPKTLALQGAPPVGALGSVAKMAGRYASAVRIARMLEKGR